MIPKLPEIETASPVDDLAVEDEEEPEEEDEEDGDPELEELPEPEAVVPLVELLPSPIAKVALATPGDITAA